MNSFALIALVILPLLFLAVAFRPAVAALSQFRWITCPRCNSRADYTSRRGWTKLYRCADCEIDIVRRRAGSLEIVREARGVGDDHP